MPLQTPSWPKATVYDKSFLSVLPNTVRKLIILQKKALRIMNFISRLQKLQKRLLYISLLNDLLKSTNSNILCCGCVFSDIFVVLTMPFMYVYFL